MDCTTEKDSDTEKRAERNDTEKRAERNDIIPQNIGYRWIQPHTTHSLRFYLIEVILRNIGQLECIYLLRIS